MIGGDDDDGGGDSDEVVMMMVMVIMRWNVLVLVRTARWSMLVTYENRARGPDGRLAVSLVRTCCLSLALSVVEEPLMEPSMYFDGAIGKAKQMQMQRIQILF